jgi:hypothetical protein
MKIWRRYVVYVVLPLVLGAMLYVFFRKETPIFVIAILKIFRDYFGFAYSHHQAWHLSSSWNWIVNHFPDALWAFSLTSFVLLATRTDSNKIKCLYYFLSAVIIFIVEITVGKFDWLDLVAMSVSALFAIAFLRSTLKE